jgi:hypothetical protein
LIFIGDSLYKIFSSEVQLIADSLAYKVVKKLNHEFAEFKEIIPSLPYKMLLTALKESSNNGISGYHFLVKQNFIKNPQLEMDIDILIEEKDSNAVDAMNFSWGVIRKAIEFQLAKKTAEKGSKKPDYQPKLSQL